MSFRLQGIRKQAKPMTMRLDIIFVTSVEIFDLTDIGFACLVMLMKIDIALEKANAAKRRAINVSNFKLYIDLTTSD